MIRRKYSATEREANRTDRRPNNATSGVGGVDPKRFSQIYIYIVQLKNNSNQGSKL